MLKNKRGVVLPFVLMTMMLTQLLFFSVLSVYESHMQTYIQLKNHYQSQTLLGVAERTLQENKEDTIIIFNIGEVRMKRIDNLRYELTAQLINGYSEIRLLHKE